MEEILELFSIRQPIHCIIIDYLTTDLEIITECNLSAFLTRRVIKIVGHTFGIQSLMIDICRQGKKETIEYIIDLYLTHCSCIDQAILKLMFKYACNGGNYEIAKWLDENYDIDCSHLELYPLFDKLCNIFTNKRTNNIFNIMLLVIDKYEKLPLNTRSSLVSFACACKSLVVLNQLYSIDKKYVNDGNAFVIACEYGNLKIVEWLGERFNFTINDYKNGFKEACISYRENVITWFIKHPNILSKIGII
jgi:hypothetical protein